MIWIVSIIVGGVIGWLISLGATRRNKNMALNTILGILGALLFFWLFSMVLGITTASAAGNFWLAILWSIIGSGIVLAIAEGIESAYYGTEYIPEERTGRAYPHEWEERMREDEEKRERERRK